MDKSELVFAVATDAETTNSLREQFALSFDRANLLGLLDKVSTLSRAVTPACRVEDF